jgi:type VI secretion system protein ImpK
MSDAVVTSPRVERLSDCMRDGFCMQMLIRNGHRVADADELRRRVRAFLKDFEQRAAAAGADPQDVHLAQHAYCALLDETVLARLAALRATWERCPLQLELFGDHLAGETFFEHLEQARQRGRPKLQLLEVFHLCLLLGFQGRYLLEGPEKLDHLTARVGDEIARLQGEPAGFAPRWRAPDRIQHRLRAAMPLWGVASFAAAAALLAYGCMWSSLAWKTNAETTGMNTLVQPATRAPRISITLP